MSKRTGDKSRANRQQKHKMLMRKHSRELGKPVEDKEDKATAPGPTEDGNQVVSSRLRQLTVDGKADPTALEIVVSPAAQGAAK
jgi:hypothetical protein